METSNEFIKRSHLTDIFSYLKHPHDYPDKLRKVFGQDFLDNLNQKISILRKDGLIIIHNISIYKPLRKSLKDILPKIESNPQGDLSIDPSKDNPRAQELRAISLVKLNDGTEVVVKSTGKKNKLTDKDREDLIAQFLVLKGLEDVFARKDKDEEKKDGWSGFIRPVHPYGVVSKRWRDQGGEEKIMEHLFMEYGGERLKDNYENNYFNSADYPELVNFIEAMIGNEVLIKLSKFVNGKTIELWSIENLSKALEKRYGIKINLRLRDILCVQENGRRVYRIIDIKPHELERS